MIKPTRILRASLLAAALPLCGCFATKATPVVHHYRLSYEPPLTSTEAETPIVLRVVPLRIAAVYATEGILYREDEFHIEAFGRHRWSTDPSRMITDLLQRDLAASGAFRAVQQGPSTLPSDFVLRGEIEEIEERGTPQCNAHLRLRMLLAPTHAKAGASAVAFQKVYESDEPTRCGNARAVIESLSRALARLSEELQRDILAAVSENPR